MSRLSLRAPGLRDMAYRQRLLSQPETMAYNRHRDMGGAEGYDPETGCIDFSRENWRWWRQIWLLNEPDFYAALLWSETENRFVGEVSYFRDAEAGAHVAGILIEDDARGRGYCAEGLGLLIDHAFARDAVERLCCAFPGDWIAARKGYLRAGFRAIDGPDGAVLMTLERGDWMMRKRGTGNGE